LGAEKIQASLLIWRPDPYQSWTRFATSEQTTPAPHRRCGVIYQDTPRGVGLVLQDDFILVFYSSLHESVGGFCLFSR
jgi:hypothetical protein